MEIDSESRPPVNAVGGDEGLHPLVNKLAELAKEVRLHLVGSDCFQTVDGVLNNGVDGRLEHSQQSVGVTGDVKIDGSQLDQVES